MQKRNLQYKYFSIKHDSNITEPEWYYDNLKKYMNKWKDIVNKFLKPSGKWTNYSGMRFHVLLDNIELSYHK